MFWKWSWKVKNILRLIFLHSSLIASVVRISQFSPHISTTNQKGCMQPRWVDSWRWAVMIWSVVSFISFTPGDCDRCDQWFWWIKFSYLSNNLHQVNVKKYEPLDYVKYIQTLYDLANTEPYPKIPTNFHQSVSIVKQKITFKIRNQL